MSFQVLRYIVAAAQIGHFGRAAERCNVTQPSLSERIRRFEEYLGVIPTVEGRSVVELAARALEIERQIKVIGSRFAHLAVER